jgi:alkanesulfonate monooxygenase SsuD/methylene tetrahydromethanopterin reductase-like flavin-dependent oxidoreductase (luciferase family)
VQLCQQHCTIEDLRKAWTELDRIGVDSIWVWDHFFPIEGSLDGPCFEAWTLLTTIAAETSIPTIGTLVCGTAFRSPELLAHMAATLDAVAPGRLVLGIGAGWHEPDFTRYGIDYPGTSQRLKRFEADVARIRSRLSSLSLASTTPSIRLLVGGGSPATLRVAAKHADAWNCIEPAPSFADKSRRLDQICEELGRDPAGIERTVGIDLPDCPAWRTFAEAGATHLIVGVEPPFRVTEVAEAIVSLRDA